MRLFLVKLAAVAFLVFPSQNVIAQSPELPVPNAVVKDADGKVIGEIIGGITRPNGSYPRPAAFFEIGGETVVVAVTPNNLIVMFPDGMELFFSDIGCTGEVFMNYTDFNLRGFDLFVKKPTFISGPNSDTGEFRVFQTTSETRTEFTRASELTSLGECTNFTPSSGNWYAAQEVLPNPLEGFHGPTTANPERVLTIEGGTRLP